jgi:hypothetical protein
VSYLGHDSGDCDEYHGLVRDFGGPRPRIVCLCGSTRFFDAFREANLRLTLAGEIVLSIGCDTKSDADLGIIAGDLAPAKVALDELHKRKIDLADYVFVLNVGQYVGESTRSEIEYANRRGKEIRFLEPIPLADVGAALGYATPPGSLTDPALD